MADNTVLNPGVGGDTIKTEDTGAGFKIPVSKIYTGAADVNGGPVTPANPLQVVIASGSQGVSVVGTSLSTMPQSGSLVSLMVGGVAVSHANPIPIGSAWDQSGQVISGSTVRTVQYAFGDFASGSANQVVPPQGANNMIRVLSAMVMGPNATTLRWISTGSAGTITNLSGLAPLPGNGGYVLPFNQHGWFQTKANEGLNAQINTAGGTVGITLTWIITGP